MRINSSRRPKLALPYTILQQKDKIRLIAGEDFRYTFSGQGLEQWLPKLLSKLDGTHTICELLENLEPEFHETANQLLERIYAERIAIDAPAIDSHLAICGETQ